MNTDKFIKTIIVILNFSPCFFGLLNFSKKHLYNTFLRHKIKKNTILVTDPIVGHGEVMPGIVKYCLDLGYNVEVLITTDKKMEKPFSMFKGLKIFAFPLNQYTKILQTEKLNEYKKVIFTSARVYYNCPKLLEQFVFDYFKDVKIKADKIIFIEHHLDLLKQEEKEKYSFAGLPDFSKNYGISVINPHYFGQNKIKSKNKITKFVVAGALERERKNHLLLPKAVKKLLNLGITDFEVIVIGGGNLEIEDKEVQTKIKLTGRLTYEKMYNLIRKTDYILGLFDPDNTLHDRYIKDGTSGTYQLVYGFLKPLIVHKKFAIPYKLNNENSIIYDNLDTNLAKSMEFAIKETPKSYLDRVQKLYALKKNIYSESIKNLKNLIEGINE